MIDFTIKPEARKRETPRNIVGNTYEPLPDLPEFDNTNAVFFKSGSPISGDGTLENPCRNPYEAAELLSGDRSNMVCLDSSIYEMNQPLTISGDKITGIFSAVGESCTFRTISDEIPDGFIETINSLTDIRFANIPDYIGDVEGVRHLGGVEGVRYFVVGENQVYYCETGTQRLSLAGEIITTLYDEVGTKSGKIYDTNGDLLFENADFEIDTFFSNLVFVYDTVEEKNKILKRTYSPTYEISYVEQTTNIGDPEFENERVHYVRKWGDYIILATNNNIYYSTDGLNYTLLRAFTYASRIFKLAVFNDCLYILFEDFGIFKANSVENFVPTKISSISPYDMNFDTYHLYVTDTSGNLYRLLPDGNNFVKIKSGIGKVIGFSQADKRIIIDNKKINLSMIVIPNDYPYGYTKPVFNVFNIKFETNILNMGIELSRAYGTKRLDFSNLDISGFKSVFTVIEGKLNENNYFRNSIIHNQHSGIYFTVGKVKNCIFKNLTGTATHGIVLEIYNSTFYNVKQGILYREAWNPDIDFFNAYNNIIYFAHEFGLKSLSNNPVYAYHCLIGRCSFINAYALDSTHANPLFVSETDLHIRTKESGYQLESPAKEAGSDHKDIGAFDVERTTISQPLPVVIRPISQPSKIEQDSYRPYFQNALSISGGKLTAGLPERKRISLEWDSSRYTPDIDRLAMLLKNKVFYFSNDDTTYTGTGIITTEIIADEMALFALSDIGDTFKVYRDEKAGLTYNELTGFQFQSGEYSARILYNTETEIYFSADSDIPDGVVNAQVKYIKVVCTNENLKATRITQKTKLRSGFTLTLEEAD